MTKSSIALAGGLCVSVAVNSSNVQLDVPTIERIRILGEIPKE